MPAEMGRILSDCAFHLKTALQGRVGKMPYVMFVAAENLVGILPTSNAI
ncbi:hypothetical protein QUF75_02160 [Desulfococcaceae bacterium HSG7]|nr:hypothetical protein [Desulfococcaceae bacterium HSG7]